MVYLSCCTISLMFQVSLKKQNNNNKNLDHKKKDNDPNICECSGPRKQLFRKGHDGEQAF